MMGPKINQAIEMIVNIPRSPKQRQSFRALDGNSLRETSSFEAKTHVLAVASDLIMTAS